MKTKTARFVAIFSLIIFLFTLVACNNAKNSSSNWDVKAVFIEAVECGYDGTQSEFYQLLTAQDVLDEVEIVSSKIDENNHLILTLSNGRKLDAGIAKQVEDKTGRYRVVLDYGEEVKIVYSENYKLAEPAVPEKEGYIFLYWYSDSLEKWDFEKDRVTEDMTLYAAWKKISSSGDDPEPDRPNYYTVELNFWGFGDYNEISVFANLVDQFNELYKGEIKVNYQPQVSADYDDATMMALSGHSGVDVLYVNEHSLKGYAEKGYLEPLDDYLAVTKEIKLNEIYPSAINRFKYDLETGTSNGKNAHYWGIPKDLGTTALFYNETYFNEAGVKVFSVAASDLAAFNSGAMDARGKTKAEYGIAGEVKEKGYFIDANGAKWFNNQVPMSWDECVTLSNLVQNAARAKMGKNNIYGYYTEWWYNYCWSVGGDCIQYVPTSDPAYNGGYWDFTLMDATPNFIVADDNTEGFTVNGKKYNAGEIIEWGDKVVNPETNKTIRPEVTAGAAEGKLNQLPSQREAFVEFVRVGQKTSVLVDDGLYGYGICPDPKSIGDYGSKDIAFTEGKVAMLVDGRWNVTNFRQVMDNTKIPAYGHPFVWDVAPLPMYKEYDAEGNITVHGVEAGHSGSVALCINAKSDYRNASWKFIEFVCGRTGQTAQAEAGFSVPIQMDLANSEVFLQSDKNPRNSIIFTRAASYQTPSARMYLRDDKWIDDWANCLNGEVRDGLLTLSGFEQDHDYLKTWEVLKNYTKKS